MAVGVSQVRFSEHNDPHPTYVTSTVGVLFLFLDYSLRGFHPRGDLSIAGYVGIFSSFIAATSWIYCFVGCIWHPIPKEYRGQLGMTSLQLESPATAPDKETSMLSSLDSTEEVGADEVEVRDHIQWAKMAKTTLCVLFVAFSVWYTRR